MVTQKEYVLPADMVILSTADLKGNIVDYNVGFREASGYSDAELKGKPHNILRHPDMPKDAFKDFWQTIQSGQPWFGIVKNKRKNGDHYWVAANASPIIENGKITGYLSVRYPASRDQIMSAETLYRKVSAGQQGFPWTRVKSSNSLRWFGLAAVLMSFPVVAGFYSNAISPTFTVFLLLAVAASLSFLGYKLMHVGQLGSRLKQGVENIANGHFRERIADNTIWGFALNMIRSRVGESAARSYDQLRAAEIMTKALDTASTNIMIADNDFNIIRMNKSLMQMFNKNESKLKAALPAFDVKTVLGSNMDIFHRNPAHQREMMASLQDTHQAEIRVGQLVLRLTVSPIDFKGQRLGFVVEWLDRTIEANIVDDIAGVVEGLKLGVLNRRVNAEADGAFEKMKQDINQAMEIIESVMSDVKTISLAQAGGDLTQRLTADYGGEFLVLKNAINSSMDRLNETVSTALIAAEAVSTSSGEVAQGAINLSQRVQEQAAALEQSSATMEQISAAVEQNAQNSQAESDIEHDVEVKAKEAADVMQKTIGAMNAIQESSHKISEIVSLIDSIAFQTNLLALNAAVEAARAGDHGRGFAVVAGEVRALAQKSAEAAKDIKDLIGESVARIDQGTKLARESGDSINDIANVIEQVSQMSSGVCQASKEQAVGVRQMQTALMQIDQVTQQNAALVEQTSAAAEDMSENALELRRRMAFFKTTK